MPKSFAPRLRAPKGKAAKPEATVSFTVADAAPAAAEGKQRVRKGTGFVSLSEAPLGRGEGGELRGASQ